jgi:hypothetical protein
MVELSKLQATESVVVDAPPELVYGLIADVTRMGELSPVCKACWWDEGAGPVVGSWFTGRNVTPEREWERRCEVVVAERPQEFAWMPGGRDEGVVRWGYTFEPTARGTIVHESWTILKLSPFFLEKSDEWLHDFADRTSRGMSETLAALKQLAESEDRSP